MLFVVMAERLRRLIVNQEMRRFEFCPRSQFGPSSAVAARLSYTQRQQWFDSILGHRAGVVVW